MFKIFKKKKLVSTPSYFEYSSEERKRIIKEAAKKANKLQLALVEQYDKRFSKI